MLGKAQRTSRLDRPTRGNCSKSSNCSRGVDTMLIKKAMLLAAFLLQAVPLAAYPLVDAQCKDDPEACVRAGKLAYVSIYGRVGYEDLAFFEMVDAYLPPDAPFPRVYLNSYGGKGRAGIGIGRILHKHHATVESGSPVIPDTTPQCSSACALLAQGAYHRRLTHVGLHGPSKRVKLGENLWETQAGTVDDISAYMMEMGAAYATKVLIEQTSFDEIADFYFDPSQPIESQAIYKLRFYDVFDQYFSGSTFAYPEDFNFTSSEDYMINAANYGSIQAMIDLSEFYTTYDPDVKPDFAASARWLKRAAEKGDEWSMHTLGYYHSYGIGVDQDKAKGAEFYMKAAKLGLAASQNNLGWAYYTGAGVPKSLPDAVYWITKAAEQGEPFAYGSLCEISGATNLFKNDPAEAFMWCGLAIEHLPDGDAKDAAKAVYFPLVRSMSHADYTAGDRAIKEWNAKKVTDAGMRNVGDDLN